MDFGRQRLDKFYIYQVTPENYITNEGIFNELNFKPYIYQTLTDVNVTRESTKPGQTAFELLIQFRSPVKIPNRSVITYYIPREQVLLSQFSRIVCFSVEKRGSGDDLDCQVEERNATHTVLSL